jgi:type I restriction enzyme S subunit
MAKWQATRIGKFLKEREGRYDPTDSALQSLKRLNKIDFSGEIHLSDKGSKTDMIIVEPGDLVISGINVSKGALAVYHGDEPITATIHYSSYSFDETEIDIEYFKRFLKSQAFVRALKEQVKGGIKTEIKSKLFLPLEINLPEIESQRAIVSFFNKVENEMEALSGEITFQQAYLKKLRQQILQEAIEGKLSAAWRKKNPDLISGEKSASKLLEKIKAQKDQLIKEGKIKKEKPFAPITDTEKPFALPEGWVWCRLGEASLFGRGKSKHRPRNDAGLFINGTIPFIQTGEVSQSKYNRFLIEKSERFYNEKGLAQSNIWPSGTLCITIAANIAETGFLTIDACFPDSVVGFTSLSGNYTPWFVRHYLSSIQEQIIKFAPATAQKNINLEIIGALLFPMPPLAEQQAIVERVDKLMIMIDKLEKQVTERKDKSERLMQSVLREAFEQ